MQKKTNWAVTILLSLGSILILFPLYLTVVIALKTPKETADSILALPKEWRFQNFLDAIEVTNFFHAFQNSLIITVLAVIFTLLTNSMVAYAIARNLHKKFYKFLFYYFVSAMFVPFPIIMLPIVKQTSSWGMDNIYGLIFLYIVYGLAFNVFVYVGYIKSIPKELEEAAIVDGASTWQVFWKVIFPLLTPMNATVGILTCLWVWNDFMLPLVILSDREMATLPLVQYMFQSQFSTDYNLAFASYLMALAPMIIVYVFAQKWIISGVTKGAIK
ncbi:carbohydrate ABC transporter permease [Parageobacillus thermoglucosidasius]|jgi:raffinose/stachyose/melibiose transport system permease protein|uniref:carbohydrate ABC transporter permease n=1 Tax=Parageobacillus thermoglucosidasius TaxID=1426 RepID=UPI0001D17AE1|nr:carbohydrate ABC transporter permease [Parageobacillus thermoglucosidasius]AEH49159.1 ABC-type transporter, integral membrane subunit [Parageobacillus thermoglucosidasius C56-YS93]